MNEPNLRDISDYDSLSGEKKKVVIAVILSGIVLGLVYTIAYNVYDKPKDALEVEKAFKHIPMK